MILVATAFTLYLSLLFLHLPFAVEIVFSCALGFVLATIGFNIMHDACHGSYSSKKWVNELFSYNLIAPGGNSYIWRFKHNILHHTFTNIDGLDDDIGKSPLMRQCTSQKWVPAHRFQHIYAFFVYAISSIAWIFLMDFDKYFKQKIYNTPIQKIDTKEHLIFWLSKILYIIFYIAIPVMLLCRQKWAIGFALLHVFMGRRISVHFVS